MPRDTRPEGNRIQPDAYPHKQINQTKIEKVDTVRSGKVVGEKKDYISG